MQFAANARALRLAGVLVAVLAFAACAKNPADDASLAGAGGAGMGGPGGAGYAAPGSPQDFVVNVGDRVFFDSDSVELTPTAQATLEKQARWLQQYNRYAFTIEGHADERGTREYNFALGFAARGSDKELSCRPRYFAGPHAHRQLRQGASGRRVQRHFLLVAEPPRRDGAQRRAIVTGGQLRNEKAADAAFLCTPTQSQAVIKFWPNCARKHRAVSRRD